MILYLDGSALVKRYTGEPGTRQLPDTVAAAAVVGTSLISQAETAAALTRSRPCRSTDPGGGGLGSPGLPQRMARPGAGAGHRGGGGPGRPAGPGAGPAGIRHCASGVGAGMAGRHGRADNGGHVPSSVVESGGRRRLSRTNWRACWGLRGDEGDGIPRGASWRRGACQGRSGGRP